MRQTEIKPLKPLKRLASHPGLFIQGEHSHATHKHIPAIIPPIFPYHSITINSSPSSYNPFSLHLLSPFHYDLFTTSPLSHPPFSPSTLLMLRPSLHHLSRIPSTAHPLPFFFGLLPFTAFPPASPCTRCCLQFSLFLEFPLIFPPFQQVRWRSWRPSG